ncbi:hydroxymethylglutaryl-CoA synthase family protein [Thermodesulfobacteriota bacterium]
MVGIRSYGAYIPRHRLIREKIFEAMGWLNPATRAWSKGEKAVANYDEDAITMAVAAGMNCIDGINYNDLEGVYFASTSMPFQERQNAGIIATALGMSEDVRSADFSGSLRSGTSALIAAFEAVGSGGAKNLMACTSECRLSKLGSAQEMNYGDAAAAFLVSDEDVVAEYKGSFTLTSDFGDRVRGRFSKFDRQWEDRWIRDMGYENLIPRVIDGLLEKYNLEIGEFSRVIYCCHYGAARKKLNKILGIDPEKVPDIMIDKIGDMGSAQSLVMLTHALEDATAGDKILVVSFGSGCDALYLQVTDKISDLKERKGVSWHLANAAELDQYQKYLAWRNIVPIETGLRGEEDLPTRWSAIWRANQGILGFWGSRCTQCGTPQFPRQRICVNPSCGSVDEMEAYRFSEKLGKIASFTGDYLAASTNPPQIYGNVVFDEGGKVMMNFTDCDLNSLHTGMPVSFSFRIKYFDERRDIYRYFWKAVPTGEDK